jgi:multidrug efflux pump subunit AcrA (membrane-fusion protein)
LLRPGLLADVEIIVERMPDVLHVPQQAMFKKNGKPLVYVKGADGRFTAREVEVLKQSESVVVLKGGVNPGDVVALADPTADKSKKDDTSKKSDPMSSMPGGK